MEIIRHDIVIKIQTLSCHVSLHRTLAPLLQPPLGTHLLRERGNSSLSLFASFRHRNQARAIYHLAGVIANDGEASPCVDESGCPRFAIVDERLPNIFRL